jgi:peroxiredoxin
MTRFLLLWLAAWSAFAGPPAFRLRDTQGREHSEREWRNSRAVVVFFIMTDCPLSNGYVPEMNRIAADYSNKGVAVYAAHSDPFVTDAAVRKHVEEFGYAFPVLLDSKLTLARATGATIVPQAAVLSPAGEVLYLGRIDNRVEDITRRRPAATERELRAALDAVVAGKAPAPSRTRAVGCYINLEGIK